MSRVRRMIELKPDMNGNTRYPNFSFIPTFSNKNANSLIDR